MTKRIPQPRSELSPSVRAHEAKLLSVMLRTSRLTWVFGEPGTDTGALLKSGVMPLLQRRRGDRGAAPSAAAAGVLVTPERRRRPARPRAEVAILFDEWRPAPLSALKRRIVGAMPAAAADTGDGTLAQMLQRLHQQLGLHVVVLLDRFEAYLAIPPEDSEVGQFADELFDLILQQAPPASFLIAMSEAARPRLERFRARMPDLDHDALRLSPVSEQHEGTRKPARAVPDEVARAPQARRPSARVPIKVEDVYALIESTLSRNRALEPSADWHCDVELDLAAVVPPEGHRTASGTPQSDKGGSAPVGPRKTG